MATMRRRGPHQYRTRIRLKGFPVERALSKPWRASRFPSVFVPVWSSCAGVLPSGGLDDRVAAPQLVYPAPIARSEPPFRRLTQQWTGWIAISAGLQGDVVGAFRP
jgi:hypothetical protein